MADSNPAGAKNDSNSSSAEKLRVAGAWSGQIEVPLDHWTIKDLRRHLSGMSGILPDSLNIICAGKILKDETPGSLRQCGLNCSSKLLMTRAAGQQVATAFIAEEERQARLARIKEAADAMVRRSNENPFSEDSFDFQLENQSGEKLKFNSDSDRRALTLGLMLHSKARDLIVRNVYTEALEVLSMAEAAFVLCDPKILEAVDNVAFLQIDTVWCYFMLKDIEKLTDAGKRLSQAREGLHRAHGHNLERLRVLQGGFCPELAVYVRLELLEGIVAFHSGHFKAAKISLVSAESKYNQLQVSDEALAFLVGMGFSTREAQRALRVSGQDVNSATEFAMEERKKKKSRKEEDIRHQQQRRELKGYGKTPTGQVVDLTKLEDLVSIGYERVLAAEALRQSDNDIQTALDTLTDPIKNAALQSVLAPHKQRRRKRFNESELEELIAMGFARDQAIQALENSSGKDQALDQLLGMVAGDVAGTSGESSSLPSSNGVSAAATGSLLPLSPAAGEDEHGNRNVSLEETRDIEMEDEIAMNLTGDPLAEYDIDVHKEGEAILEYLAMVNARISS